MSGQKINIPMLGAFLGVVAAAAMEVASRGVVYVSSAGNSGHQAYHSEWNEAECPDFDHTLSIDNIERQNTLSHITI